jgi:DNA-binding MarR family transcriptional regulator
MSQPDRHLNREQLRTLTNPLRMDLYTSLRTDGPATAKDLAKRLDGDEMSLYYHLRQLAKHGLIETESRPTATKPETLFKVGGAFVVKLDLDDPANLRELQRNITLVLKNAIRDCTSAAEQLGNAFHEQALIARAAARLSEEDARELRRKVRELNEWVAERSKSTGSRYCVTISAVPLVK